MAKTPNEIQSILVVTGETSGELHAAGLMRQLRMQLSPEQLEFFGSGGRSMAEEGAELLLDVSRLAAIGPWTALAHAKDYLWLFGRIVQEVRKRKPRLAILVDFPEFNLRLAPRLKAARIPVCYFISPQVWAWRAARVKQIRLFRGVKYCGIDKKTLNVLEEGVMTALLCTKGSEWRKSMADLYTKCGYSDEARRVLAGEHFIKHPS